MKAVERERSKWFVANSMGVPRTSVVKICKKSDAIISEYESRCDAQTKRQRVHKFSHVDKHLMQWFPLLAIRYWMFVCVSDVAAHILTLGLLHSFYNALW